MKKKVFIDGQHGTVGLQIRDRLSDRSEIELIEIEPELRKDNKRKQELLNESDFVFLCLPDEASRESVSLIRNPDVTVLDGSTAHRVHPDWVYGIPELNSDQRGLISESRRITVPGCYATGFNLIVHPLVSRGILPANYPVSAYAITGYSGGGKQMIEDYSRNKDNEIYSCRPKNLDLKHKHLPEMKKYGLLKKAPIFTPIVGNYYQGMLVFLPLYKHMLSKKLSGSEFIDFYSDYFQSEELIHVISKSDIEKTGPDFIDPTACNGTNDVDLFVFNEEDRILIVSRFDNLGKGASGAAVQNLNILLGVEETKGLLPGK